MSDRQVGVLTAVVWAAALFPLGGHRAWMVVGLAVAAAAMRMRWPWLLIVGAALAASTAAGGAWAAIEPVEAERFEGEATLVADPEPAAGGVRVVAVIDGSRYDLRAWGSAAGWLRPRLMGERVQLEATLRPLRSAPPWMLAQGLEGRGTVTHVTGYEVGAPHTRLANSIRRTIESGAASLDRDERALFAGLVYGDDRDQSPLVADNFDAAGLTHLLAVSGQNVAFVLAIAGPVLRRLGFRERFAFVVAVLLLFATVTRFEASVVRASVMTAVAAVAALVGTEVSSRRVLSLAIAGLILVDPLIVHSVAFQLSVAASAGILLWSGRVARAVPGPRPLVESLAVTATAQLAVAPLLIWRFDGLPVASLPSNLLAGPAAGPVMMWGLTGGLFAGLVPAWLAAGLHVPTKVAVWWIDSVASLAPQLPFGRLGAPHVVVLFAAGAIGLQQQRHKGRLIAAAVIIATLIHPGIALALAPATSRPIDDHSTLWRDDHVTVVELDAATRPQTLLAELRHHNVGAIDVIIVHQTSYALAATIGWIRDHHEVRAVWAPTRNLGVGEIVPAAGAEFVVDGFRLTIDRDGNNDNNLTVEARAAFDMVGEPEK